MANKYPKYDKKELDTVLNQLENELRLAVTKEERDEIKASIRFFLKERQLA